MTQEGMDEIIKVSAMDGRKRFPGKNCRKGWGIASLLHLVLNVTKLDFPKNYRNTDSDNKMKSIISKIKYLGVQGSKSEKQLYTPDEIQQLSNTQLRRALYWTEKRQGGYLNVLCNALEDWFKNTKWNGLDMLIPDNQLGIKGGHKKSEKNKKTKTTTLMLHAETIIPINNTDKFKLYIKNIKKMMSECFNVKKYNPEINNWNWVMIFLKNKLAGFVAIDNDIIQNVCVSTNYHKRGIANQVISYAICKTGIRGNPRLLVNNFDETYNKLIKLYTDYGFSIIKKRQKNTIMGFKCP